MEHDQPTSQSIDQAKALIIAPALSRMIIDSTSPGRKSFLDIGTGDASFVQFLISQLEKEGIRISDITLVDIDTAVLPAQILRVAASKATVRLLQFPPERHFGEGTSSSENSIDIANMQMVAHQIANDAELSLIFGRLFLALRSEGVFFLTGLDPKYIEYLYQSQSPKFTYSNTLPSGTLVGTYHLDETETRPLYCRPLANLLAMLIGLGFDIKEISHPSLAPLAQIKPRYGALQAAGIPMFQIIKVAKGNRFISFSEGIVARTTPESSGYMFVEFMDGDSVIVPDIFVAPKERLVLLEVTLPDKRTCLTQWAIPETGAAETRSRVFISKK
ncbi:MAG: hypothetical protein PHS44_00545 [Candidatus Dojkabacteria bacterium]|nr:hypothetical protein [Candidatus Dojkabacteria bacterium]